MAELPQVFAPSHGDSLDFGSDKQSVFQHTTDSFNKNPELANSLSRVMAGNLDSVAEAGVPLVHPDPSIPVQMDLKDSERLLFLASQSHDGRDTLTTAKEAYDNAVAYQLTHGGVPPESEVDVIRKIAALDAHIDDANYNSQTYQHGNEVAKHNDQAQKDYQSTKDNSEIAKKIVDSVPVPGGPVTKTVKDVVEDQAFKAIMKGVNPPPKPELLQFPIAEDVQKSGNEQFSRRLDSFSGSNQSSDYMRSYLNAYKETYDNVVSVQLVRNSSDLEQLATGGKQAPKSGS